MTCMMSRLLQQIRVEHYVEITAQHGVRPEVLVPVAVVLHVARLVQQHACTLVRMFVRTTAQVSF